MLTSRDFQAHAAALAASETSIERRIQLARDVFESIELVHTNECQGFLSAFFAPLLRLLQTTQPAFADSSEHRLRNTVLAAFSRLPMNEVVKPYAAELLRVCVAALGSDNEENALIASRIAFDLHKSFRPALEEAVPDFLDFARKLYENVRNTYAHFFETLPKQPSIPPLQYFPSLRSFKVLAETPLQVMFLLNLYTRAATPQYVPSLLPLMVQAIQLPEPDLAHMPEVLQSVHADFKNSQVKTLSFLTYLMRVNGPLVLAHKDTIARALVKALQTCPDVVAMRKELLVATRHGLVQLKSSFYEQLELLLDESILVGRGRTCIAELRPLAFSMLAELIHHVRQDLKLPQLVRIIYLFSRNIHDDSLPVNVQCTSVRLLLNLVEVMFSRRQEARTAEAHRMLLVRSLDAFVSKLSAIKRSLSHLLLIDHGKRKEGTHDGEGTVSAVAEAQQDNESKQAAQPAAADTPEAQKAAATDATGSPSKPKLSDQRVILYAMEKTEHEKQVADARMVVQNLVMGLKTLLYSIANYGNTAGQRLSAPTGAPQHTVGLREEEVRQAARALAAGIPCLQLFKGAERVPERPVDIYDSFADIFTVLQEPRDLVEMLALRMGFLFDSMLKDERLLRVAMQLLSNVSVGPQFAHVLLTFLVDQQLPSVQQPDSKEGVLTLRLLGMLFDCLSSFPAMETVIAPAFPRLILSTLNHLVESEEKGGYLELLALVFRPLSAGKFEQLLTLFGGAAGTTPLLLPTLTMLRAILKGPGAAPHRDLLLELCLIMPARLSEQLAGLPRLMSPLVSALKGPPPLVQLALRILEYWIDSLNPEFLEPAMAGVSTQLLTALISHLKPEPYPFGAKALQLLGKLGGRNRRFLKEPMELEVRDNPECGLRLILTFQPSTNFLVPLDRCIALARTALAPGSSASEHHRQHALALLQACATSILCLRSPDDSTLPGTARDKLAAVLFGNVPVPHVEPVKQVSEMGQKTKIQLTAERQVLKCLMAVLVAAGSASDLNPSAAAFRDGMCRHFALLFAAGVLSKGRLLFPHGGETGGSEGGAAVTTSIVTGSNEVLQELMRLKELSPLLFLDALVEVLSEEEAARAQSALDGLAVFLDALLAVNTAQKQRHEACEQQPDGLQIADSPEKAGDMPMQEADGKVPTGSPRAPAPSKWRTGSFPQAVSEMLSRVLHCCYGDTWPTRLGGAAAVHVITSKLPREQLTTHVAPCVRALFAVARCLPNHAAKERKELSEALQAILTRVLFPEGYKPPPKRPTKGMSVQASNPATTAGEEGNRPEGDGGSFGTNLIAEVQSGGGDGAGSGAVPEATAQQAGEANAQEGPAASAAGEEAALRSPRGSNSNADAVLQTAGSAEDPAQPTIMQPLEPGSTADVMEVIAQELLNPRADNHVRKAANMCLQLVADATNRTAAVLLRPVLDKVAPPVEKKRLLPLKHVQTQAGHAAVLTWLLQQRPCPLALSTDLVGIVSEAFIVTEADDPQLLAQLATAARPAAAEHLDKLRLACLNLVCAALTWEELRTAVSPTPAPPADAAASVPRSSYRDKGELNELRNKAVQMLFKQLTSPDKAVVDIAQEGLSVVIRHQRMPKALLQTSLRPILVQLAYYNKLQLPLLKGLACLLQLLSNWFNITLGEKLIDHLKKWLEPEKVVNVPHSWEVGEEAAVAAATLNLFHLLPSQASKFLETSERPGLVVLTIELEGALALTPNNLHPTKMWSPYREPLTLYLNKYCQQAVAYFLDVTRMANPCYFHRLLDIIRSSLGKPLLLQLSRATDKLVSLLCTVPDKSNTQAAQVQADAQMHCLHLLAAMVKLLPAWLPSELVTLLHQRWLSPERKARAQSEETAPPRQLMESKRIAKALMAHVLADHAALHILFDLLDAFTMRTRVSLAFLREFFSSTISQAFSLQDKQEVLRHFLEAFRQRSRPQEQLVHAARLLILPMLEQGFASNQAIVEADMLNTMVADMFDPPDDLAKAYGDGMKLELLRLATLLIQKAPQLLVVHRKELIKFGWNHLKRNDSSAKYYAFLNVCHFLDAYHAPEKIVLQVFVALLRTCDSDARKPLVRQALDVLTPALVRQLPPPAPGERYPIWVRYTKKVLVEEGHQMSHLIHIWQLLVRHADMFYSSRAQFVPQMVTSLMKLGLPQNAALENRRLAIDLAALMVRWEVQRITQPPSPFQSAENGTGAACSNTREEGMLTELQEEESPEMAKRLDGLGNEATPTVDPPGDVGDLGSGRMNLASPNSPAITGQQAASSRQAQAEEEFRASTAMQEMVLSFLTRMAFLLGEAHKDPDYQVLYKHTLGVLSEALALWPGAPVRVHYIDKLLTANQQANLNPPPALLTGLQVMRRVLDAQPETFMQSCAPQMLVLLDPCFASGDLSVVKPLAEMLVKLHTMYPIARGEQSMPKEALMMITRSHEVMMLHLSSLFNSNAGLVGSPLLLAASATLQILTTLDMSSHDYVSKFTPQLVKLFHVIEREHTVQGSPQGSALSSNGPVSIKAARGEPAYGTLLWVMCTVMQLCADRVLRSVEHKKTFLQAAMWLISGHSARMLTVQQQPGDVPREVTDVCIHLQLLRLVRQWVLPAPSTSVNPASPTAVSGMLTEREAILFLERFAQLQRNQASEAPCGAEWEAELLDLIYNICSAPNLSQGPQFQKEVFERVERATMLGLKARDPATRAKFTDLYNRTVPASLYHRLEFIVLNQEWEPLSGTFWLKQALDLLLAMLVSNEPLRLAFNSAHVAPLLSGTRQSTFPARPPNPLAQTASVIPGSNQGPLPMQPSQIPQLQSADMAAAAATAAAQPSGTSQAQVQPQEGRGISPGVPIGLEGQAVASSTPNTHGLPNLPPGQRLAPPRDPTPPAAVPPPQQIRLGGHGMLPMGSEARQPQPPPAHGAPPVPQGSALQPPAYPMGPPAPQQPGTGPQPMSIDTRAATPTTPSPSPQPSISHALPTFFQHQQAHQPQQLQQQQQPQQLQQQQQSQQLQQLQPQQQQPQHAQQQQQLQLHQQRLALANTHGSTPSTPFDEPAAVQPIERPPLIEVSDDMEALMSTHLDFLRKQGRTQVKDLMGALGEVAGADPGMAYLLWVLVFPIVWATLSEHKEQQVNLAKPIIALLSKQSNARQAAARPNVVQALLEGISLCQPQPKLPSELIKYLGKTFCAWHIAIPLLESHVFLFPEETRCFDAVVELYAGLQEEDILAGLWKRKGAAEETRNALAAVQHGLLPRAQNVLTSAVHKMDSGGYSTSMNGRGLPKKGEQCMWQQQWLAACNELAQWDTVVEVGNATDNQAVLIDSLWKQGNFADLKSSVFPKALVEDTPGTTMVRAYVHLQENSIVDAEQRLSAATTQALSQWWSLPDVGLGPQTELLAVFQRLVELQESARIIMDLSANRPQDYHHSDLRDILETWRLRTPNEWEKLSTWAGVLLWRNNVYNSVITTFKNLAEVNPVLHQLGYRDKAWSVNKLGSIARKQGSPAVCREVIGNMYGYNAMEVQEAFNKIREQARAFLAQPEQLVGGLNLVNQQDLVYFQPLHQAELFRLKGIFLQELGEVDDAHNSFSTAIMLCTALPDGWLSWGAFCDARAHPLKDKNDPEYGAVDATWLDHSVTAYLQGVRHGSEAARGMLPRLLSLLSFENEGGVVGSAIERGVREAPLWVWLAWLPQLLMSLQRPEAPVAKQILILIATQCPQALYYGLRTYLLGLRDTASKAVQLVRAQHAEQAQHAASPATSDARPSSPAVPPSRPSSAAPGGPHNPPGGAAQPNGGTPSSTGEPAAASSQPPPSSPVSASGTGGNTQPASSPAGAKAPERAMEKPPELIAFETGREVMEQLRNKHASVSQALEYLCTDIGARFVPKPEERLLSVVHALLHRCYKLPFSDAADVPDSLKNELAGVCRLCFSAESTAKHGRTVASFREPFERDLNPLTPGFPTTLGELALRLKTWRTRLQNTLDETMPACLHLEAESRNLQEQSLSEVEMPGQHLKGSEVTPEATVCVERVGADIAIVRRHGTSARRLAFYGSDGRVRYFLVQTGQQWSSAAVGAGEERLMQVLRMLNRLLDRHPEARRRDLAWNTPSIIPVWPQVRLVEEDCSYCSYGEAYEVNCARYGREVDAPIVAFKRRCCNAQGQLMLDPDNAIRLAAYTEIEQKYVIESIFSQFMYKTLPTCNHLFVFKKQFCMQMALSGMLSHMLLIGGRAPNKVLFSRATGKAWQTDLFPVYDAQGVLERNEPVPFRLTRNLQSFFTIFGIEGIFVTVMACAAQAATAKHTNIRDVLTLFFRDDIIAWSARRSGRHASAGAGLKPAHLKQLVQLNVDKTWERLVEVAPNVDVAMEVSVQAGAQELVDRAMSPVNLCRMDPTWHPWF